MNQETAFFLADITTFIGLIPSVLAFFRIKSPDPSHRRLAVLVWWGTFISLSAHLVSAVWHMPNLFLLHIYTVVDFILLTFIFRGVLPAMAFRFLLFAFPLFAAVNSLFFEKLMTMNVLNRSISAFILMFYALSFFAKTLREMKVQRLERYPLFWISIGVLFYNAGSFFIFLFSSELLPAQALFFTYFGLHAIFTILLYTFYTIALWVRPTT